MNITVKDRQTIFDIALINAGTAEAAFAIAYENELIMSNPLISGSELSVTNKTDNLIIRFYETRVVKPATTTPQKVVSWDFTFDLTFRPANL